MIKRNDKLIWHHEYGYEICFFVSESIFKERMVIQYLSGEYAGIVSSVQKKNISEYDPSIIEKLSKRFGHKKEIQT